MLPTNPKAQAPLLIAIFASSTDEIQQILTLVTSTLGQHILPIASHFSTWIANYPTISHLTMKNKKINASF